VEYKALTPVRWLILVLMLTIAVLAACDRPRGLSIITPTALPIGRATSVPLPEPGVKETLPTGGSHSTVRERIVVCVRQYARMETHYRLGHCGPIYFDCTGVFFQLMAIQATKVFS